MVPRCARALLYNTEINHCHHDGCQGESVTVTPEAGVGDMTSGNPTDNVGFGEPVTTFTQLEMSPSLGKMGMLYLYLRNYPRFRLADDL
uniref:hypothetical protein n=1 Tax=Petrachloros mirabilis TaxID=2918835 RepID=UPI001EE8E4E1|nr:hypothetical protein [Petrachloros mirabilis]